MDSRYIEESRVKPSGSVTYLAARYSNSEQSGKVYNTLHSATLAHNLDTTVLRVLVKQVPHVILLIDNAHLPYLEDEAKRILTQYEGQLTTVADDLIQQLIARRSERTKNASRLPGSNRYAYESHTPTPINIAKPASSPTPKQGKPFIIEYRDNRTERMFSEATDDLQQTLNLRTFEGITLVDAAKEVYAASLRKADKYLFTPSALAMHKAVFALPSARPVNNHTWLEVAGNVWIEFSKALEDKQGSIKALYLTRAYPQTEIDQVLPASKYPFTRETLHKIFRYQATEWTLAVIREDTRVVYNFTYELNIGAWTYPPTYKCPYNQCAYTTTTLPNGSIGRICLPCEQCKQDNWYWSHWLKTALLIVNRHYATSPEPGEFPSEVVEYEAVERVTVGHGKNKRKVSQQVKRRIDYRLVKFEVSTSPRARPVELKETEVKRANWLVLADRSSLIYEKHTIAPYKRRYPTGTKQTHQPTELVEVGEHIKYVPMLSPEKKTIKKVIASRYDQTTREGY